MRMQLQADIAERTKPLPYVRDEDWGQPDIGKLVTSQTFLGLNREAAHDVYLGMVAQAEWYEAQQGGFPSRWLD